MSGVANLHSSIIFARDHQRPWLPNRLFSPFRGENPSWLLLCCRNRGLSIASRDSYVRIIDTTSLKSRVLRYDIQSRARMVLGKQLPRTLTRLEPHWLFPENFHQGFSNRKPLDILASSDGADFPADVVHPNRSAPSHCQEFLSCLSSIHVLQRI